MTVGELKELLDDMEDEIEVRLAHQPEWPFEYEIRDVAFIEEDPEPACDDDGEPIEEDEHEPVVYLVEGEQIGYLPGYVSEHLGWR